MNETGFNEDDESIETYAHTPRVLYYLSRFSFPFFQDEDFVIYARCYSHIKVRVLVKAETDESWWLCRKCRGYIGFPSLEHWPRKPAVQIYLDLSRLAALFDSRSYHFSVEIYEKYN